MAMDLEYARDLIARDLIQLAEEHGVPNSIYNSELSVHPLIAGRIGNRFMVSLQQEITRRRPADSLRVAYGPIFISGSLVRKGFRIDRKEA